MTALKGTYRNGQILLSEPANWPEGTEVIVEPIGRCSGPGLRDEDWPTDPEGLARLLARMDQTEPLEMTPQEEAAWETERKMQREYDLAHWEERVRRIERSFE
jgi:hypothetical protein